MTRHSHLVLDSRDNLAVALRDLAAGQSIAVKGVGITLREAIPAKQKFALRDFAAGDLATLYGVTVGAATQAIPTGSLIHTGNLAHRAGAYSLGNRCSARHWTAPDVSAWKARAFDGYLRANGQVGTANHWIVAPLVFCENRNLDQMRDALHHALGFDQGAPYRNFARKLADLYRDGAGRDSLLAAEMEEEGSVSRPGRIFANIDGVKFLTHGLGCGGTRDDARALCGLLAGYITHPNVAGATVLSLGCQNAQVEMLLEEINRRDPAARERVLLFEQQRWPTEKKMLEAALRETFAALIEANEARRAPAPLSKLILGVECGGSDGFSGISANPVIGRVSDLLVALDGRVILSEFPELCGVEQDLIQRCATHATAKRFVELMGAYSKAAEAAGAGFDQNPSPGNIRDGLITDAMKSAGAAKKGGTSLITAVLDYPETVTKNGLNLLCTPGGDVESTTAMAGAHATLMLFSTGLGTPTGNPVASVIKVSSNTDLATRMTDIIDFDAGPVIDGGAAVAELGDRLLELAVEVASGRANTKAELLGQDDFLPWKRGVSL